MHLLLLLIFFFLFPWVFLLLILVLYVLIPLGFSVQSFLWIVAEPSALFSAVTDGQARRNHAIMHGTIQILEREYGALNIEGMPTRDGFSLRGFVDPEPVLLASREALSLILKGGQPFAFHARCGISVLLADLLLAFLLYPALRLMGIGGLLAVVISLVSVYLAGSRLGPLVQRLGLVSDDLAGMEIVGVEVDGGRMAFGGFSLFAPAGVFVRTRKAGAPRVAEVISP